MSFFPNNIHQRQMGLVSPVDFNSAFMKMKLKQQFLSRTTELSFGGMRPRLNLRSEFSRTFSCQIITPAKNKFFGAWDRGTSPKKSLCVGPFFLNSQQDYLDLVTSRWFQRFKICGLLVNCNIVDMCCLDLHNTDATHILYVARSVASGMHHIQIVPGEEPLGHEENYIVQKLEYECKVHSCAWNKNTLQFTAGTEHGIFLHNLDGVFGDYNEILLGEDHRANFVPSYYHVFNSQGNLIYFALQRGFVTHCDTRCLSRMCSQTYVGNCLSKLKLLSDDVTVVVSGVDSVLCSVDTRMNRVLLNYEEQFNPSKDVPFHIDESLGMICSCGEDLLVRYWNLKYGNLLGELSVQFLPKKDGYIYSALEPDGNSFCTRVFSRNEVYCFKNTC